MTTFKKSLSFAVLTLVFLVPFLAFLVPGGMFFPFISGKGFAFRVLVEILFGLYLVLAASAPEYRPKFSWITKAVLLFVAAIFISDLLSANAYKSFWSNYERMEGFVLIFHLALYYIVASSVLKTESLWRKLWNTSIGASVLMSLYGFAQIIGSFAATHPASKSIAWFAKNFAINQGGVRLDGTFGNATYLAIYLVFHIFLCLYILSDFKKPNWQKWAYRFIIIFESFILYFTATRGAISGLLGGLVLAALLIVWKEKQNPRLRKIAGGSLIFLAICALLFFAVRNTTFVKNSPVLSRFTTLTPSEFKNQGRYYVWPMAIKGFLEKPVFGWGQESFNFVFNKYYDPRMYGQEQWFDRTHDIVLDWLVAGGAVGFLAYASMYVALLYYVWRKKSTLTVTEKSIFTGMIAAYIFHNIFVFDNLISYIIFFSLLAYMHSLNSLREENAPARVTHLSQSAVYGVSIAAVVLVAGGIYFVNWPAYRANTTLIQAISQQPSADQNLALFKKVYAYNSFGSTEATEQLTQVAIQVLQAPVSDTVKQGFVDLATQKIEEKVKQSPHDARYLLFAGSFFNRIGKYDDAVTYLTAAIKESPKKQPIYFELGSTYLGKHDGTKAFEQFKAAYDLEPDSPESKLIYFVGAVYTGNTEVAKEMVKKIDSHTLLFDDRILKAYAHIHDYNSVISILMERLKTDPTNAEYKLTLASVYSTIGQKQKAIDLIREVIKANPSFKDQGESYIKQIQG